MEDPWLLSHWRGPVAPVGADELADRHAVCRLPMVYALGIDQRDEALVRSAFAADAVLEGTLGTSSVDDYVPRLIEGVRPYVATMHNITNQYCSIDGDMGTVWSYAICNHLEDEQSGRPDLHIGVQYRDRVRRGSEGWAIVARRVVLQWVRGPLPRPE